MERDVQVLLAEYRKASFFGSGMVARAVEAACAWHKGQMRNDGKTPYIVHPLRVGLMVEGLGTFAQAAAICHDLLEDTEIPSTELWRIDEKGEIMRLVWWLTSPDKDGSRIASLNREQRKRLQREKIAHAPWVAQAVKMADRLDNLRDDPDGGRPGFLVQYRKETLALLDYMNEVADNNLHYAVLDLERKVRDMCLS